MSGILRRLRPQFSFQIGHKIRPNVLDRCVRLPSTRWSQSSYFTVPSIHKRYLATTYTENQIAAINWRQRLFAGSAPVVLDVLPVSKPEPRPDFQLDRKFVELYRKIPPPFGFNGLGELVFFRTYSRVKPDGSNEEWFETVERVVNGTYTMLKRWCARRGIKFCDAKGQKDAKIMYRLIFEMKFLPPGRGLWAMGSPLTMERENYAALNNCAFVSTENIADEPYRPFQFLMDASMLGVGVGFDTKGAGKIHLRGPNHILPVDTYVITDDREGWVHSVRLLLGSIFENTQPMKFDYSKIRPAGSPIVGFGGVASGPWVLERLHHSLSDLIQYEIYKWQLKQIPLTPLNDSELWTDYHTTLKKVCEEHQRLRDYSAPLRKLRVQFNKFDAEMQEYKRHQKTNPVERAILQAQIDSIEEQIKNIEKKQDTVIQEIRSLETGLQQQAHLVQDLYERGVWKGPPISVDLIVSIMNMIGQCVVAGNVRRTAEIAFVDPSSPEYEEFLHLKDYERNPHRADYGWTSNNSVFADLGMNYSDIAKRIAVNGEPGVAWLENMRNYFRMDGMISDKDKRVAGGNPCLTGDTMIFTDEGLKPITELIGKPFTAIVDGHPYSCKGKGFWKTGERPVKRIRMCRGMSIQATDNHQFQTSDGKWIEVNKLRIGDRLVLCNNNANVYLWQGQGTYVEGYDHGHTLISCVPDNTVLESGGREFSKGVLQGILDTYATHRMIGENGQFLTSVTRLNVNQLQSIQRLLLCFGIPSQIQLGERDFELLIAGKNSDSMVSLSARSKFITVDHFIRVSPQSSFHDEIVGIETCKGTVPVYDVTIPGVNCFSANGIKAHNCLEQSLESYELCCLVETFPNRHKSKEEYLETLKRAYLYAKIVTLGHTPWEESNRVMIRNHRIGTSVSGIAQFLADRGIHELREWLDDGYDMINSDVHGHDKVYSEWLGVPRSIKTTSVKPSGTVSILAGATSGIHFPESRFYIRRIRMGKNDPLVPWARAKGFRVEPAVDSPTDTVVVERPIDCGKVKTLDQVSMWEQLELAAFMQRWWADNQVSATVTFNPKTEGPLIGIALDFYQYRLKGISFLPRTKEGAYPQMPYEAIDEATYHKRMQEISSHVSIRVVGREAVPERGCNNDTCGL